MSTLSSTFGTPLMSTNISISASSRTYQSLQRLFWTLNGPISSAISVMSEDATAFSSSAREPYCLDEGLEWHSISQELLIDRSVQSISVNIENMALAALPWLKRHQTHLFKLIEQGEQPKLSPPRATDGWRSRVCCEELEPHTPAPLKVVASSPAVGVTIHDYVSAVHPWLMENRADVIAAMRIVDKNFAADDEALLVVNLLDPRALLIQTYLNWDYESPAMRLAPVKVIPFGSSPASGAY